jgi:hypothetical protein
MQPLPLGQAFDCGDAHVVRKGQGRQASTDGAVLNLTWRKTEMSQQPKKKQKKKKKKKNK